MKKLKNFMAGTNLGVTGVAVTPLPLRRAVTPSPLRRAVTPLLLRVLPLRRCRYAVSARSGQASTELLLILPLFLFLAAGAICFTYMCWQGIKVQQAANLAARMQGQQRIGGGTSSQRIDQDNGLNNGAGDELPTEADLNSLRGGRNTISAQQSDPGGVYGEFRTAVRDLFSEGERRKLFVPPPIRGINSDQVKVVRVLKPPRIFNVDLKPMMLEATAYGGEDTRMYGLPRWGGTAADPSPFYQKQIQGD